MTRMHHSLAVGGVWRETVYIARFDRYNYSACGVNVGSLRLAPIIYEDRMRCADTWYKRIQPTDTVEL